MNALDTNVWIYSHDSRDAEKQRRAQQLIADAHPMVLPWQVGCEFVAAARRLEQFGFSQEDAWAALDDMRAMAAVVAMPTSQVWPAARDLQARFSLSFWDAVIVAACLEAGVQTLYTEDFGGVPVVDGLNVVNPFAP